MTTTIIKERGLIFSGHSVRQIYADAKSKTRRPMKQEPFAGATRCVRGSDGLWRFTASDKLDPLETDQGAIRCPYGWIGDRLWARETAIIRASGKAAIYRADVRDPAEAAGLSGMYGGWKSPRFMPRRFSRLILEITDVRAQPVQNITEDDAIAEGYPGHLPSDLGPCTDDGELPSEQFRREWDCLNQNRGYGWESNPWVWALSFKRMTR